MDELLESAVQVAALIVVSALFAICVSLLQGLGRAVP